MIDSETVVVDVLKAAVPRDAFADRVSVVARALSTRASVLVLGGMRLHAENGNLELAATDMELSLRAVGRPPTSPAAAPSSYPAGSWSTSRGRCRKPT